MPPQIDKARGPTPVIVTPAPIVTTSPVPVVPHPIVVASEIEQFKAPELTREQELEAAFSHARAVLQTGLQALIKAGVPESDSHRLETENAFETVRAAQAQRKFDVATLNRAVQFAKGTFSMLANTSKAKSDVVQDLRGRVAILQKAVDKFGKPA